MGVQRFSTAGMTSMIPIGVGFVSDVEQEAGRPFTRFDTEVKANGNQGHLYGTDLIAEEKRALLEYLKTL